MLTNYGRLVNAEKWRHTKGWNRWVGQMMEFSAEKSVRQSMNGSTGKGRIKWPIRSIFGPLDNCPVWFSFFDFFLCSISICWADSPDGCQKSPPLTTSHGQTQWIDHGTACCVAVPIKEKLKQLFIHSLFDSLIWCCVSWKLHAASLTGRWRGLFSLSDKRLGGNTPFHNSVLVDLANKIIL